MNSNDGKHKAYLYEFSCSATTGNAYEVSILEVDQTLHSEQGNIYSSTSKPYSMAWVSNDELEIGASSSSESYRENERYQNVRVSYIEPDDYNSRFNIGELMKNIKKSLAINFNSAATKEQIQALEKHIGYDLPSNIKDTLLTYNGQVNQSGWHFLSTEEIVKEWDHQKQIWSHSDPMNYGSPAEIIQHNEPWDSKRIPIMSNGDSGIVAIDLNPAIYGTYGQIITVYDDDSISSVLSQSYADFLIKIVINEGNVDKMTHWYEE
jgi:cell wall assembly regulator SMI1